MCFECFISWLITNEELYVELRAMIHEPFRNDEGRYVLFPFCPPLAHASAVFLRSSSGTEKNTARLTFVERLRASRIRLFASLRVFPAPSSIRRAGISRILLVAFDIDRVLASLRTLGECKEGIRSRSGERRDVSLTRRRLSNKMFLEDRNSRIATKLR